MRLGARLAYRAYRAYRVRGAVEDHMNPERCVPSIHNTFSAYVQDQDGALMDTEDLVHPGQDEPEPSTGQCEQAAAAAAAANAGSKSKCLT